MTQIQEFNNHRHSSGEMMKFKHLLATGDPVFLYRYQYLFKALTPYFEKVNYLPSGEVYQSPAANKIANFLYKAVYKFSLSRADQIFQKNPQTYIAKSQNTERKIQQLSEPPDFVLQVFGMFSPFWNQFEIPYGMYLDYTMSLAAQKWQPWTPFANAKALNEWMNCERKAYQNAYHLFPMSEVVKQSLITDYGVNSEKITVVGSSGNFEKPYEGEKSFGTQQILFNGSDFERKGGELVVAAFQKVRQVLPNAQLVIIGKKVNLEGPGIENPGKISHAELRDRFAATDLVMAPSYCEPFQEFLLEAMNYGCPCLVSDVDGMPEIVTHEENGIVVHEPTAEQLAQSAIALLKNPERLAVLSASARQKIKTQLNWQTIAEKIVQVL